MRPSFKSGEDQSNISENLRIAGHCYMTLGWISAIDAQMLSRCHWHYDYGFLPYGTLRVVFFNPLEGRS